MQLGRVVGHATATVKHASLTGWKLLLVQLLDVNGGPDGEPVLCLDALGAGAGDDVVACNDGGAAQQMVGTKATPARWFVAGIRDA